MFSSGRYKLYADDGGDDDIDLKNTLLNQLQIRALDNFRGLMIIQNKR